ncbi:cytidine deaminase [candidate division WOR-3 bacterium]|nr:cytidine deaminase [candidate division WOR-3 bacterium]
MAKISSPSAFPEKGISKSLVKAVTRAIAHSYAPYSRINVSAGVYCPDGSFYTGANIENSSYGLSMCAERVAMYNALTAGERTFSLMLVYSPQIDHIAPCGACLQVIAEFAPEMIIATMNHDQHFKFYPLSTLLQRPFRHPERPEGT